MPIQKLRPTFTFTEDRLKQLEQVVPEAFADGKIDWETLYEALGEELEDGREEHFGLTWPGKREARKLASTPSKGTLIPCPGEGINEDTTENIFIEGENLEVLKILLKSYAGKVKMIYIDPPYNTGNDFIYNDNFTDPLEEYLKYTGSKGESGELLTSNTRADGRFHSRWLNMMLSRILIARLILSDDGVIFISIDDNELANLKLLADEVFGGENFIGNISRITKTTSDAGDYFAPSIDYVLVYSKNKQQLNNFRRDLSDKDISAYNKQDESGKYKTVGFYQASLTLERSRNARYFITCPDGSQCIPPENKRWRCVEPSFFKFIEKNEIEFLRVNNSPLIDENGQQSVWNVYTKQYLKRRKIEGRIPRNFIDNIPNVLGTKELKDLGIPFNFPKPSQLIFYLSQICQVGDNDIVMDFFSGSSSTAHAVLRNFVENDVKSQFIMVQFPEILNEDEYSTISEIGKERIRRVISRLEETDPLFSQELGFKVFSYSPSNFKFWTSDQGSDQSKTLQLFENQTSPLKDNYKTDHLMTEILLLEGFPLTTKITTLESITMNTVYEATAPDFCDHKLFICLDDKIDPLTADQLDLDRHDIFICLDSAFTDELKVRLEDRFNVHII